MKMVLVGLLVGLAVLVNVVNVELASSQKVAPAAQEQVGGVWGVAVRGDSMLVTETEEGEVSVFFGVEAEQEMARRAAERE